MRSGGAMPILGVRPTRSNVTVLRRQRDTVLSSVSIAVHHANAEVHYEMVSRCIYFRSTLRL